MDDPDITLPEKEGLDWGESPEAKAIMRECEEASRLSSPVVHWISGVRFVSRSKGRGRPRRYPVPITLLSVNGDHHTGRWRFVPQGDHNTRSLKWDELATETFGPELCEGLERRGIHPDDHLRSEINILLVEGAGKF